MTENEKVVSIAKFTIEMEEKLELGDQYPMSLILARAVVKQDEELSALREKCRWRKYPEETPGEDCYCLVLWESCGRDKTIYKTLAHYKTAV